MSRIRRYGASVSGLLLLLLSASAVAMHPYPQRPSIADGFPVSSISLLRDASGQLRIEDVSAETNAALFTATPQITNTVIGYSRDVFWLRFRVGNPHAETRKIFLEAGAPRLMDVQLYERGDDRQSGNWRVHRAGLAVPVAMREVHSRYPVFPVTLAAGEQREMYLRIASRNAIAVTLSGWVPDDFHEWERHVDLLNGVQFGAIFLLSAYGLLLYAGTRDRTYLYFALVLAAFGGYDLSFYQYGFQYFWPHSPEWALRSTGFFIAMTGLGCSLLTARLLRTRERMPVAHLALRGLILVTLLAAVLVVWLDYDVVIKVINVLTILVIIVNLGVSVLALARGYRPARLLFMAFLFLWLTSLVRAGQIFGALPLGLLADFAQSWSVMISGVLMAVSLSAKVRNLDSERLNVQRDILRAQVAAREKLEEEVGLRVKELREAKENAERADAAKSRFLAQLSHELRTPLHSLLGNTGLMLAEARSDEDTRRLSAVQRSGRHQLALIEELLEFVRGDAGKATLDARPVWLRDVLQGVIDEMQPLARARDVALLLQVAPQMPDGVVLDAMRVRQVLLNLISNGCRHSHGRVVSVQVSATALDAQRVRLCFEVHDDGQGISESDRDALFDPFWQSVHTERGTGLGLGLPISRQWVRLMGGNLEYSASIAGGSLFRFCIEVPLSAAVVSAAAATGAQPGQQTPSAVLASGAWNALPGAAPAVLPGAAPGKPLRRPSDTALARLRVAAGLGLVTDIDEWVQATAAAEPDAAEFVEEVRLALARVDLPAIRRIAAG